MPIVVVMSCLPRLGGAKCVFGSTGSGIVVGTTLIAFGCSMFVPGFDRVSRNSVRQNFLNICWSAEYLRGDVAQTSCAVGRWPLLRPSARTCSSDGVPTVWEMRCKALSERVPWVHAIISWSELVQPLRLICSRSGSIVGDLAELSTMPICIVLLVL